MREHGFRGGEPAKERAGRVLLAEDNAANRKVALAMLQKLGYAADAATNGLEALEALSRSAYDAVLMDCRMPEMDGFEATAAIRRRETSSARTPIIAMTADAMEGDRRRCLAAGMDDYLSKPVSFRSLQEVLERWIPPADLRPPSAVSPPPLEGNLEREDHSLDPAVIADLRELDERREGQWMSNIVSEFLREVRSDLKRLRLAVEQGDGRTAADRSHALAGSLATFGARRMSDLCRRLKALSSQGQEEAAPDVLTGIEVEFDRVAAALIAEFPASEGKG